jgi:hypothetical protein
MNAVKLPLTPREAAAFRASAVASGSDDLVWLADRVAAGDLHAAMLVRRAIDAADNALRSLTAEAVRYRHRPPA